MIHVIALIVALILNATANLLMKVGMQTVDQAGGLMRDGLFGAIKTVLTSATLFIGLSCFALNAAFYMFALQSKALKISVAYPIMVGGGFAMIAIIARFHPALNERLTNVQMIGVGLILVGVITVASSMGSTAT